MYEIEKGIERPEIARPDRVTKYPWSMLEIGDSFFVPNKKPGRVGAAVRAKKFGFKFSERTVDGGVRIWRIA